MSTWLCFHWGINSTLLSIIYTKHKLHKSDKLLYTGLPAKHCHRKYKVNIIYIRPSGRRSWFIQKWFLFYLGWWLQFWNMCFCWFILGRFLSGWRPRLSFGQRACSLGTCHAGCKQLLLIIIIIVWHNINSDHSVHLFIWYKGATLSKRKAARGNHRNI